MGLGQDLLVSILGFPVVLPALSLPCQIHVGIDDVVSRH